MSTRSLSSNGSSPSPPSCRPAGRPPWQPRSRPPRAERLNPATIGRGIAGEASAKHTIERARRSARNPRVEARQATAGVAMISTRKRTGPLIVSFDRADVRDFHTLMAARIGGRAVLLVWAGPSRGLPEAEPGRPGERPLCKFGAPIPAAVPVIILADRGSGRAAWAAVRQELTSRHVVRIKPDVTTCCPRHRARRGSIRRRRGGPACSRAWIAARAGTSGTTSRSAGAPTCPGGRDEPRSPRADLDCEAERACRLHARRMGIEELSRDGKGKRNGRSLRDTRITRPDRFDRFPLIVAPAYVVPAGPGAASGARLRAVSPVHDATCAGLQRVRDRQGDDRSPGRLTRSGFTDDPPGNHRGRSKRG